MIGLLRGDCTDEAAR